MRSVFFIPFLFLFLSFNFSSAQSLTEISGTVIDSLSRQPMEFVQAGLFGHDGKVIATTATNENGVFQFTAASGTAAYIKVSFVGYNNREVRFTNQSGKLIKLRDILLVSAITDLAEVKVTGTKKTVVQKPGMLVYNAADDPDNKGGTAADVLRKAPVLSVDAQGNVSMRGNRNIKILIDGKYSGQMARSAADALNMIPSDIIASVEIITTPSAKYDAEGAAGVINIVTKKDRKLMNGSLEASVSNWEQVFNPRISSTSKKWNLSANAHLHRLRTKSSSDYTRENYNAQGGVSSILLQSKLQDNTAPHGSASFSVDFTPDTLNQFSLGFTSWFGNWPENTSLNSRVLSASGAIIENYSQRVDTRAGYLGGDINLGYTRKFKKPGREFNLLAQFSPSKDHSDYVSEQVSPQNQLLYKELNESYTRNSEWTFQADYLHSFDAKKKYTFEGGLKLIDRKVSNDYQVQGSSASNPAVLVPVAARTDIFDYSQAVYAAYAIMKFNLPDKWFLETGARLEHTRLSGNFASSVTGFNKNFNNFIPTATISKKINDAQSLSASYTKRLTRPYIWDLNPNPDASDPKNIVTGNPALDPELANQAEIAYSVSLKSGASINSALFWRQTDNSIEEYTVTDQNGISTTSKQNLAASRQLGLNIAAGIPITSKFKINSNLNLYRMDFSSAGLQIDNQGWNGQFNMSASYKLSETMSVQAFGDYANRTITLQGYKTPRSFYSLTMKKELPLNKLSFILAFYNPFNNTINQRETVNATAFTASTYNRQYYRTVKFTVTWAFGKLFEQKQGKKINNDDVKARPAG